MKSVALWFALVLSPSALAAALIQSIWSCMIPCAVKGTEDVAAYLQVAYCATEVMSPTMLATLDPLCREKAKRGDVVAARRTAADVAACVSSGTPCAKPGLTSASFTCHFVCPSEDGMIRKFTACAKHGDEAWQLAARLCKAAVRPDPSFAAPASACTAEGQASCEG